MRLCSFAHTCDNWHVYARDHMRAHTHVHVLMHLRTDMSRNNVWKMSVQMSMRPSVHICTCLHKCRRTYRIVYSRLCTTCVHTCRETRLRTPIHMSLHMSTQAPMHVCPHRHLYTCQSSQVASIDHESMASGSISASPTACPYPRTGHAVGDADM